MHTIQNMDFNLDDASRIDIGYNIYLKNVAFHATTGVLSQLYVPNRYFDRKKYGFHIGEDITGTFSDIFICLQIYDDVIGAFNYIYDDFDANKFDAISNSYKDTRDYINSLHRRSDLLKNLGLDKIKITHKTTIRLDYVGRKNISVSAYII